MLFALIMREMGAKTGESRWAYFWAVAEPLGGIVLLTAAFSIALMKPPLGSNFPLFYATGVVPFVMYSAVSNTVANALQANRGLLTYPVVTILDTIFARWILETMTHAVIAVLLFYGLMVFYDLHPGLREDHLLMAMLAASALGLGIGTLNCVLNFYYPIWRNIWGMLNRPLFIISAVMFTFESLPPQIRDWMWFNPLIHIVGEMRMGFYGGYSGSYISLAYVFCLSAGLFLTGAYVMLRNQSQLIQN